MARTIKHWTENWLFRVRRERFRSRKSGKTHDFYVTDLADGVHAIAVTADQKVVMVRQFPRLKRDSLETLAVCSIPVKTRASPGSRAARGNRLHRRPS